MRNLTTSSRQFALATEPKEPDFLTPSIRLVSATPFAIGNSSDANQSVSNSSEDSMTSVPPSVIAPKSDAPPRKRLVPKKSKLGLLGPKGKDPPVSSDQRGADNPSAREGFEIFVDPTNDPEFSDVLVVKKQKSRGALNGVKWGALGEVTNVSNVPGNGSVPSRALKFKEEDKKWWSIRRGRKDSKDKENTECVKRSKSPEVARSKTPEPFKVNQDTRIRFNSLDSGVLLRKSTHAGASLAKASTASDPEQLSRLTHYVERSSTPDSLKEACRSPSPDPPRSVTSNAFLDSSKEQGSIALRAIRSVKSLARMGSRAQMGANENDTQEGVVREKKQKKVKKERKEKKETGEGTLRDRKERKEKKKERKEKKDRREDKENISTLRHCTSTIEAGTLTGLDHKSGAQTLGQKKRSILGMGLNLPSSLRLRSGSSASSILAQPTHLSAGSLGNEAKKRMGSTISTASSMRPHSTASSSGGSAHTRESRGSVRWDEVCLENRKKEIQRDKKEKRKKRKEEGKESKKSNESKRRVAITDIFPEVASDQERDVQEEIQKRYSSAFPIATIEEAPMNDNKETSRTRDPVFNGEIIQKIEKIEEEDTPVKRHRMRPMSEQLLGKPRPRAVYEDDEGVISVLDAATSDLAQLINNLDLEATPASADPTPIRPPPFPAGILDSIQSNVDFNLDLLKKGHVTNDSPLKKKTSPGGSKGLASRSNTASITSLRPYAQSRGKATKSQATPVFSDDHEATIRKKTSEISIGQQITPWPVLIQQLSPVKEQRARVDSDNETAVTKESPLKFGTWKKGHKRSVTPVPEPEPGFVFEPLCPPKSRTPKISEPDDGKATLRSSGSFFGSSSVASNLANIVKGPTSPSSSLGRRASAFLRKHCSLLPVVADVSGADASFACAGLAADSSPPQFLPPIGKKRGLPSTLGASDTSCYAVPELDASDPDSDIPDELRFELNATSVRESDDDTFELNGRFTHEDVDEIEYPRSSFPLDARAIPSNFMRRSVFRASLTNEDGITEEIDEGENVDAESDPEADTKKSFDFTGELRRLNESSASDRHSFVEQLERAFKTPATVDLRYGSDSMMSVEVPPVPRLPLDLDMRVKGFPSRVSLDFSKFGESDDSRELSESAWQESEPGAFDNHEASQLADVGAPCLHRVRSQQGVTNSISDKVPSSPFYVDISRRSSTEGNSSVDSDDRPNRILVSANATEVMDTSNFNASRRSHGELNASFKFGGLPGFGSPDSAKKTEERLTLSDIIPPPSRIRPLSSSSASLEDESLFKSIFAPDDDDAPQSHPRPITNDSNRFLQVRNSIYRTSQASSVVSFTGFDAFEEVRRGFEFNSQRPSFYPPPAAANNRRVNHNIRDSFLSIASVSSYGRVINPGAPDPFDFGLPRLVERPSSENLSTMSFTIDDTFAFLKHAPRRKRVDSDASSFYFQTQAPLDLQRNDSGKSISSLAPPISRYNRNFATHHRSDSGTSVTSGSAWRKSWRASQRFNDSTDSIISDLASMQLGRPGLGDKMFDTSDQAMPLAPIAASPASATDMFSFSRPQSTCDSIMDEDRRISINALDSLFEHSGQATSTSSGDSIFSQDDDSRFMQGLPPRQFRPMSIMSAASSVHSLPRDDDTMITMLDGGHVRRRSLGSVMEGSPCARVEKRKQAALQQEAQSFHHEHEPPNKARIIEQPSFGSPFHFQVEETSQSGGRLERSSLGEGCCVGSGEDPFRRLPVFTRPPQASRSRSSTVTSSSGGDTPPLLISDCSSISGSSMSSIDLSDIDAMLTNPSLPTSTLSHARARARARGHGHRRRYSHVRSSKVYSVYETIEEELSSASTSPVHSMDVDKVNSPTKTQPVFIVKGDMGLDHSSPDNTVSIWDDEKGITALRSYYALQDEARSTVSESKQAWMDTPFSIFALQSFQPLHNPEGMKALLEHSIQTYGPLPSELRVRSCRSRKNSRPSPYPHTRPSKTVTSPEATHPVPIFHELPSTSSPLVGIPPVTDNMKSLSPSVLDVSDDKSSVLRSLNGTIRARARSTTRRSAFNVTKKSDTKSKDSTESSNFGGRKLNAGAPTASTEQKENVGMGSIITGGDTLRINRPRPKGRPTLASATMRALRSVQI